MSYTTQQIRAAMLRAADRIEGGAPYDFMRGHIPDGPDPIGCGCMLHYTGIELGIRGVGAAGVAKAIGLPSNNCLGLADLSLYMLGIEHGLNYHVPDGAAKLLRLAADHFFPVTVTEAVSAHSPATPASPALDPAFAAFRDRFVREMDAA